MTWRNNHNKYGNKKVYAYGIKFDSKKEAERYIELRFLQEKGLIHDLELQKKFVLIPAQYAESNEVYKRGEKAGQRKRGKLLEHEVAYYADFDYYTAEGEHVVEDTKGVKTKEYIIKRKLMLREYGIKIKEV